MPTGQLLNFSASLLTKQEICIVDAQYNKNTQIEKMFLLGFRLSAIFNGLRYSRIFQPPSFARKKHIYEHYFLCKDLANFFYICRSIYFQWACDLAIYYQKKRFWFTIFPELKLYCQIIFCFIWLNTIAGSIFDLVILVL